MTSKYDEFVWTGEFYIIFPYFIKSVDFIILSESFWSKEWDEEAANYYFKPRR